MIRRILAVPRTGEHRQLLAEIDGLERDFPGCGWADTYQDLAALWAKRGYLDA